jgi:D-alanyl-D-alanine carboxypeptidase (penicillin-binding protein 5/6)
VTLPAAPGRPRIAVGAYRPLSDARGTRACDARGARALMAVSLLVAVMSLSAIGAGRARAASGPPPLTARASVLIAPQTGQILYAANGYRELPIASTTKLMTALVVLSHVRNLDTVFTEPNYYPAAADSQIGLVPGERMTVRDLLVALMLPSADDAAEDLAYNLGRGPGYTSLAGAVAHFVAMMNAQARALGLRQTHYTTPIGLDTPGNYSTAADLVKLAGYDMTHSRFFARVVALRSAVLHSGSQVRSVVNRNDLVERFPWIDGVKTGHTLGAGYVLVASGHRHGMRLIDAVLGTSSVASRDANAMALLTYGFGNFREVTPVRTGEVLARPTVQYRSGEHAALTAGADVRRVVPHNGVVALKVTAPHELTGPLPRHAVVGTVSVLLNGRSLARIPLVLAKALPEVSPLSIAAGFIFRPLPLLVIVLLAGGGLALGSHLRQRRRVTGKGGLRPA